MNGAFYVGAVGLRTQQRALDVTAGNIANASTPGFKRAQLRFADVLATRSDPDVASASLAERTLAESGVSVESSPSIMVARAWTDRLDALEPLAVTLARTALAKLFAEDEAQTYVAATVTHHLAALRQAGATTLHVHPALVDGLPASGLTAVADPALPKDGCRVALTLGSADLSVERQWRALDAFLATLEAPR